MADVQEQFEQSDNLGSSVAYSGTATTTPANVPASADKVISGASVWNDGSVDLSVSYDGGTTFLPQGKKSFFSHDIKGEPTQLVIKTLTGTAAYKILINFEEF